MCATHKYTVMEIMKSIVVECLGSSFPSVGVSCVCLLRCWCLRSHLGFFFCAAGGICLFGEALIKAFHALTEDVMHFGAAVLGCMFSYELLGS